MDMQLHVHGEMCEILQGLQIGMDEEVTKALILMPRSSFKSHVGTQAWTTWMAVRDPNLRILLANENLEKSKAFLSHIKGVVEGGAWNKFVEVFGDLKNRPETGKPIRWRDDSITLTGRTRQVREPTFSIGAPGQTKTGMHYDIVVADDLVSERTVATPTQIEKTLVYYRQLLSLLDPGGILVVIGTRYNYDDIYGHIMENGLADFELVKKAEYEDGHLLFPERMGRAFLDKKRKNLGSYMYGCQYLNEPTNNETAVFKAEQIQYIREGDSSEGTSVPNGCTRFLLVDWAGTKNDKSDYSALVGLSVDPEMRVYVEYAEQRKVLPNELVAWIYAMDDMVGGYDKIGIEQVGLGDLMTLIRERQKQGQRYIPAVPVKTSTTVSKQQRIRMLQPNFEAGEIYLRRHQRDLIDQILRFPNIRHDDLIDALSMYPRVIYKPGEKAEQSTDRQARADVADHESWVHELKKDKHWAAWGYTPNWEEK